MERKGGIGLFKRLGRYVRKLGEYIEFLDEEYQEGEGESKGARDLREGPYGPDDIP